MRFAPLAALIGCTVVLLAVPLALHVLRKREAPCIESWRIAFCGSVADGSRKLARVGLLYGAGVRLSPVDSDPTYRAIVAELRDHGYVMVDNLVIEFRAALGQLERYPPLAAELIRLGVDVIVTTTVDGVKAAKEASRSIPIVMAGATVDPVAAGLIASLARPGGNVTGITWPAIEGKRIELLKEALPGLRSVAAFHPDSSSPFVVEWLQAMETAARRLNVALHPIPLGRDPGSWAQDFAGAMERSVDAATFYEVPFFGVNVFHLTDLALTHHLPMLLPFHIQARHGGLMSYTVDETALFRGVGRLTARILQEAKPAELPVEHPTKFKLVINLRTAKALGLTIPPSVLARADEAIQ